MTSPAPRIAPGRSSLIRWRHVSASSSTTSRAQSSATRLDRCAMHASRWPHSTQFSNQVSHQLAGFTTRIEKSHYASNRYRERLTEAGILGPMSRAGNPYENAHANTFMKTVKHEEVYPRGCRTMADVIAHLPYFLEHICNNQRQHSALNYRSPHAFEAEHARTLLPGQITTR